MYINVTFAHNEIEMRGDVICELDATNNVCQ